MSHTKNEGLVIAKLKEQNLTVNSDWGTIIKCLSVCNYPKICIKIAQKLRLEDRVVMNTMEADHTLVNLLQLSSGLNCNFLLCITSHIPNTFIAKAWKRKAPKLQGDEMVFTFTKTAYKQAIKLNQEEK